MRNVSVKQLLLIVMAMMATVSHPALCASGDTEKINPYMLFTYLKNTESQQILQARMTNITQTGEVPLPGLAISFYNNETLLGKAFTDAAGNAGCIISDTVVLFKSDDGSWPFSAVFDGDSLTEPTYGELSIFDVDIEMKLTEEDGERIVTLTASVPSADGSSPVTGEEIGVYVPRMFSLLPVSTGVLDEAGTFRAKFPRDIPGDSLGNITVIGRFNDHYFYGNVEKREEAGWGIIAEKAPRMYRSLWSTMAPKWMVVSLAVLLMGVWGHYTLVIINLIRIRRESRKGKK